MDLDIKGLHHITAITSDATEAIRFYTRILGLRLVKKTVNFDDPTAYHLYFGDPKGTPGTILTFFDWGPSINRGSLGAGVTHHIAFATENEDTLLKWKARLEQNKVPVEGPFNRTSGKSIYLLDPDGLIMEIATPETEGYSDNENSELSVFSEPKTLPRRTEAREAVDPEMRLQGIHHATAIANAPRSISLDTVLQGYSGCEPRAGNQEGETGLAMVLRTESKVRKFPELHRIRLSHRWSRRCWHSSPYRLRRTG